MKYTSDGERWTDENGKDVGMVLRYRHHRNNMWVTDEEYTSPLFTEVMYLDDKNVIHQENGAAHTLYQKDHGYTVEAFWWNGVCIFEAKTIDNQ